MTLSGGMKDRRWAGNLYGALIRVFLITAERRDGQQRPIVPVLGDALICRMNHADRARATASPQRDLQAMEAVRFHEMGAHTFESSKTVPAPALSVLRM